MSFFERMTNPYPEPFNKASLYFGLLTLCLVLVEILFFQSISFFAITGIVVTLLLLIPIFIHHRTKVIKLAEITTGRKTLSYEDTSIGDFHLGTKDFVLEIHMISSKPLRSLSNSKFKERKFYADFLQALITIIRLSRSEKLGDIRFLRGTSHLISDKHIGRFLGSIGVTYLVRSENYKGPYLLFKLLKNTIHKLNFGTSLSYQLSKQKDISFNTLVIPIQSLIENEANLIALNQRFTGKRKSYLQGL